ncbi:MAG: thermonuclease family protein [Candidatus Pacebacteria bacterium]|jgi:micrococcal nuclease|nr:thermonuclease family protein [Candidatus Paceibacterota bacterium]
MKKLLAITLIALVVPQIALASWWNPFSWFKQSAQQVPSYTTAQTQKVSTTKPTTQETKSLSGFYPVTKVIDGDTLSVNMDGTITTLRLIGINTPETVDPRRPVECFGKEASNKSKEMLTGKNVRVVTDASQGTLDKYGRTLAYVFTEDGTNFNEYMIKEGYAYEYTYNTPYQYQKEFKLVQSEAQKSKKGLWADGACGMKNVTTQTKSTTASAATIFTATTVTPTQPIIKNSEHICSYNAYNCPSFSTHAEAQAVYEACGGPYTDIHKLDQDKDGKACETLP